MRVIIVGAGHIDRRNKMIAPTGSTHIKVGDKITILTTDSNS